MQIKLTPNPDNLPADGFLQIVQAPGDQIQRPDQPGPSGLVHPLHLAFDRRQDDLLSFQGLPELHGGFNLLFLLGGERYSYLSQSPQPDQRIFQGLAELHGGLFDRPKAGCGEVLRGP